MWNKRKDCLRLKESVEWTSSRLTIRLLNRKTRQLSKVVQVLTGHCNLQRHKKTTGCARRVASGGAGGQCTPDFRFCPPIFFAPHGIFWEEEVGDFGRMKR